MSGHRLNRDRQEGIVPSIALAELPPVTLIGVGGIGSPTCLGLCKMGIQDLTVWDFDEVAEVNLGSQMYGEADLGSFKVDAIADLCLKQTGTIIKTKPEAFSCEGTKGILICAVDSMDTRLKIWESVKNNLDIALYIDGRMGGQDGRVYTLVPWQPSHIEMYEEMLYPDSEAHQAPCTERSIVYNTMIISGLILRQIRQFAIRREMPFEILFDLRSLSFIVQE